MNESRTEKFIRDLCACLILVAITFGVAYLTSKASGWFAGKSAAQFMDLVFHPIKCMESACTNPTDTDSRQLAIVLKYLPRFLRLPIWLYLAYSLCIGMNAVVFILILIILGVLAAIFSPYYWGEVHVFHHW